MQGVDAAFYLVHSMRAEKGFEEQDRAAALNFGAAARDSGLRRIIYLGGLGDPTEGLSAHLRSRQEVGTLLAQSGVPVVELRASIILGSGSISFEIIRALVERLPVMITPRWVDIPAQPLAIDDLLEYLERSLHIVTEGHRILEIGGADVVSYGEIMREYARQRGVRRIMISVPVLTPRLSGLWLGLVTPVYAGIGRTLVDSIRHPTVVRDPSALRVFPIVPRGLRQAIADALRNEDREFAETRWSDSLSSGEPSVAWGGVRYGNRFVDHRTVEVPVSPQRAFQPIQRIGGSAGWYYADWLWRLRGFLDLLAGGVGMRRGRRHPVDLHPGDTLDWWRVEVCEPNRRLRLFAEMKLPGRAWLEFIVDPHGEKCLIHQRAIFDPRGLAGLLYWYGVYPLHLLVFRGMLRALAKRAAAV
jgi:uncharacterized protein YbjT (DUF2867 family)